MLAIGKINKGNGWLRDTIIQLSLELDLPEQRNRLNNIEIKGMSQENYEILLTVLEKMVVTLSVLFSGVFMGYIASFH